MLNVYVYLYIKKLTTKIKNTVFKERKPTNKDKLI